jgi:hypothetical protein
LYRKLNTTSEMKKEYTKEGRQPEFVFKHFTSEITIDIVALTITLHSADEYAPYIQKALVQRECKYEYILGENDHQFVVDVNDFTDVILCGKFKDEILNTIAKEVLKFFHMEKQRKLNNSFNKN